MTTLTLEHPGRGVYCREGNHAMCGMRPCACDCHPRSLTAITRTLELVDSGNTDPGKRKAVVVLDAAGRRLCPTCMRVIVKKPGPGRYPRLCNLCQQERTA